MAVVIETTLGDLTVDLFVDQRPITCLNFLKLCKLKYYNFNLFHTIQHGFIAQTGDPTGKGDGGQSIWGILEGSGKKYFEGEQIPKIKHTNPGLLSMVGVGNGMIGSQFFFTLASDLASLDGQHCVIGEVTEGLDILRLLNETICDSTYRPYRDVRITHTVILEDPFNDPKTLCIPSRSPSPSAERLVGGRIAPDEELDETVGKTEEEIEEIIQAKEAKARATILEIVGDLPDADMAPPENVLFVCKLNPVTTDDDLEIIFSRFGKINSCEVIRDKKTGDSLQYAFIEFDNKKSCEDAYFKMDNVLIDDRRIHVDFSQSVSKIKWRGKGRGVIHMDNDGRPIDDDHNRESKHNKDRDFSKRIKKDQDSEQRKEFRYREKSKSNDDQSREKYQDGRRDSQRNSGESRLSRNMYGNERRRDMSPKSSEYKDYTNDRSRFGNDRRNQYQNRSRGAQEQRRSYRSRSRDALNERSQYRSRSKDSRERGYDRGRSKNMQYERNQHNSRYRDGRENRKQERSSSREIQNESNQRSTTDYRGRGQYGDHIRGNNRQSRSRDQGKERNVTYDRGGNIRNERRRSQSRDEDTKNDQSLNNSKTSRVNKHYSPDRKNNQASNQRSQYKSPNKERTHRTSPSGSRNAGHKVEMKKDIKKSSNNTREDASLTKKKKHNKEVHKKKKHSSSSESSSSEEESKGRSRKTKKSKKKRSKSSSSSKSEDSSDDSVSSSSDSEPKKKRKRKKKTKSKKYSSSSSSSSESSSSSSDESTSSSSDSGHEAVRKKSKNKKAIREKSIKKKKHKQ